MPSASTVLRQKWKKENPEKYEVYLYKQRAAARIRSYRKKKKLKDGTHTLSEIDEYNDVRKEEKRKYDRARYLKKKAQSVRQTRRRTSNASASVTTQKTDHKMGKRPKDMTPDEYREYRSNMRRDQRAALSSKKQTVQRTKDRERMRKVREAARQAKICNGQAWPSNAAYNLKHELEAICSEVNDTPIEVPGTEESKSLHTMVQLFYTRDDVSRVLPHSCNSTEHDAARVMITTLEELHEMFLKEHPDAPVSLTLFQTLRPPNVRLLGTALHWACKRNHGSVAQYLLEKGADKTAQNNDGLIPAQLTSNEEIRQLLGASQETPTKIVQLPITPNYLSNPPFPYATKDSNTVSSSTSPLNATNKYRETFSSQKVNSHTETQNGELVLKARIANSDERDFIEVELSQSTLTFTSLINLLCAELGVDKNLVSKIRKLPDTLVRNDKDVRRLKDFQELELVLTNKAMSSASRTYCLGPARNTETILY